MLLALDSQLHKCLYRPSLIELINPTLSGEENTLMLFEGVRTSIDRVFTGRMKCTSCWEFKNFYFPVCKACGRHDGSSFLSNFFFKAPFMLMFGLTVMLALDLLLLPFQLLFAAFKSILGR